MAVLVATMAGAGFAQTSLTLGSGSGSPGSTVPLNLSVGGSVSAATIQWTLTYSATDFASVTATAGGAATAAGKSVSCAGGGGTLNCVAYGMNNTMIASGVLAVVSATISSTTSNTSSVIQVGAVSEGSPAGLLMAGSGTGATVAISQSTQTTISSLSCSPGTVNAPGSSACMVTLNKAAGTGGFGVSLSSSNPAATVPASVTVGSGATSVGFTATVGSVSSNQTATLKATAGTSSQSFTLNLAAPSQSWSISGNTSSLGAGATVSLGGASVATTVADTSGNYTFSGLSNGSYTVTPSKSGYSFTPGSQSIPVNGANVSGVNFTAAAAAPSQISLVNVTSCNATTFPGSSCPIPATGSGHLLVVGWQAGSAANTSTTITIADNAGSSYVEAARAIDNAASSVVDLWYAKNVAPGITSVTVNPSATVTNGGVVVWEFAGVDPNAPLDSTALLNSQPTSATASGGAVNTNAANEAIVSLTAVSGDATGIASGNAFTSDSSLKGNGWAHLITTSGGNYSAQWTQSPSGTFTGATASFKAASSGSSNPAAPSVDVQISANSSTGLGSIATPAFSTPAASELLLAYVTGGYKAGKTTYVKSISGGGLTWVLVGRMNQQRGTAEIWRAFASQALSNAVVTATFSVAVPSSITVTSYKGVDTSGSNGSGAIGAIGTGSSGSGAPSAALTTTRANSLIVGVGVDTMSSTGRTPGAGQTLLHQFMPANATHWVQDRTAAIGASGTSTSINDMTPTADSYNLIAAEILASPAQTPLSISRTLNPAAPAAPASSNVRSAVNLLSAVPNPALKNAVSTLNVCSPGGLVTLTGSSFTTQAARRSAGFPLPTELAGVRVSVNGSDAPLLFASDSQVNFQCPNAPVGSALDIEAKAESGIPVPPIQSVMQAAAPAIFTAESESQGLIVSSATGEIAAAARSGASGRPAHRGDYVTIYATGLGEVADAIPAGAAAPMNRTIATKNPVRVVVGGVSIDADFAGLAPGTAGVYQVNLRLPENAPVGASVPVSIQVAPRDGSVLESSAVTMAIDANPRLAAHGNGL